MDSTTIDEFKIDRKIEEIKSEISSLKSQIQDLYRQKGELLPKILYRILCTPKDNGHIQYSKGLFTSYKLAKKYLPVSGRIRDRVEWMYTIEVVEKDCIDIDWEILDKICTV